MNISNNIPVPNITYINPLIQERRKKHCTCKDRTFTLDEENREVICDICGSVVDPFEVLLDFCQRDNKYQEYLDSRRQYAIELEKWFKNNRIPIEIKKMVEDYRLASTIRVLPECPHCGENFSFTDIKCFSNPKFKRRQDNANIQP